jgi:hypothetical protein
VAGYSTTVHRILIGSWMSATEDLDTYRRNTALNNRDRFLASAFFGDLADWRAVGEAADLRARLDANTTLILQRFREDGNSLLATLQVGRKRKEMSSIMSDQ